jgi:tetratricopeptide (TPR) repeat protein
MKANALGKGRGWIGIKLLAGLVLLGGSGDIRTHDSPEHVVDFLSRQMAREGASPELLFRRATEYRVLGHWSRARADLKEALRLEPDFILARAEMSRIFLEEGKPDQALQAVNEALRKAPPASAPAFLYMIRAEIRLRQADCQRALADCAEAFKGEPEDLDWYLIRSRAQALAGKREEAVRGLREGFERTGSFVLKIEWIEALIDAGLDREALRAIQPELEASRWRSSWLIRRARARLGLAEKEAAGSDLKRAIEEINLRLKPDRPDLTLLADRGLARALLGQIEEARRDLLAAKSRGAEAWAVRRLETILSKVP